jgi:hypothetical protein
MDLLRIEFADSPLSQYLVTYTPNHCLIGPLRLRGKQTCHAELVEPVGFAPNGAYPSSCLPGPLHNRAPEDDHRADERIGNLSRPVQVEAKLLPIVGGGNALAFGTRHASLPAGGGGVTIPGRPALFQICVPRAGSSALLVMR